MSKIHLAIYVSLVVIFSSCQNGIDRNANMLESDYRFDSLMKLLVMKYPELPDLKQVNADYTYDEVYRIFKRTFVTRHGDCFETPELNYELRSFSPCGGCWNYQVAYIYNDSINFILPLLDNYFYSLTASDKPKSFEEIAPQLCFERELNDIFNSLSPSMESRRCLIDNIMSTCLHCSRTSVFDLPKISAIADSLQSDNWYNRDCRQGVLENMEYIRTCLEDPNKLVYHSFVFVYVFDFDKSHVEVEVLNYPCYRVILI